MLKSKSQRNKLFWYTISVILLLSLIPVSFPFVESRELLRKEMVGIRLDYIIHAIMFLILGVIFQINEHLQTWSGNKIARYTGIFALAVCSELLHHIIDWRGFNTVDMIANISGLFLGLVLTALLLNITPKIYKEISRL